MAQRMESVAPSGGVMVSESTARLVENSAVLGEPEMQGRRGCGASAASAEPQQILDLIDAILGGLVVIDDVAACADMPKQRSTGTFSCPEAP